MGCLAHDILEGVFNRFARKEMPPETMQEALLILPPWMVLQNFQSPKVLQRYGHRVVIALLYPEDEASLRSVHISVFFDTVDESKFSYLSQGEMLGIKAWNERKSSQFTDAKENRPDKGESWGKHDKDKQ